MKTQCTLNDSSSCVEEAADWNAEVEARLIRGQDNQIISLVHPQRSWVLTLFRTWSLENRGCCFELRFDLTLWTWCSSVKQTANFTLLWSFDTQHHSPSRTYRVTSALCPRILPSMNENNNGTRANNRPFVIIWFQPVAVSFDCLRSTYQSFNFPNFGKKISTLSWRHIC